MSDFVSKFVSVVRVCMLMLLKVCGVVRCDAFDCLCLVCSAAICVSTNSNHGCESYH